MSIEYTVVEKRFQQNSALAVSYDFLNDLSKKGWVLSHTVVVNLPDAMYAKQQTLVQYIFSKKYVFSKETND